MSPQQFTSARKDKDLAVLEGFHPLKHALRFKAVVLDAITPDKEALIQLSLKMAPDITDEINKLVQEVNQEDFKQSSPIPIKSGVIAVARRNEADLSQAKGTVVWLDNPKNHENVGAVVRLVAGLDAGAVVVTGDMDVWNPSVLRGSAGLHYAIPVIKTASSPLDLGKPVYVFDENGTDVDTVNLVKDSVVVFGSERYGVSEQIKQGAEAIVAIKMKPGVSSLNLATSVAIGLMKVR